MSLTTASGTGGSLHLRTRREYKFHSTPKESLGRTSDGGIYAIPPNTTQTTPPHGSGLHQVEGSEEHEEATSERASSPQRSPILCEPSHDPTAAEESRAPPRCRCYHHLLRAGCCCSRCCSGPVDPRRRERKRPARARSDSDSDPQDLQRECVRMPRRSAGAPWDDDEGEERRCHGHHSRSRSRRRCSVAVSLKMAMR